MSISVQAHMLLEEIYLYHEYGGSPDMAERTGFSEMELLEAYVELREANFNEAVPDHG